jgi:hypothetical protein
MIVAHSNDPRNGFDTRAGEGTGEMLMLVLRLLSGLALALALIAAGLGFVNDRDRAVTSFVSAAEPAQPAAVTTESDPVPDRPAPASGDAPRSAPAFVPRVRSDPRPKVRDHDGKKSRGKKKGHKRRPD